MSISLYDASVATYIQILRSVSGVLDKGLAYCRTNDVDLQTIADASLADEMLPLSFQVHSVVHHSIGAIDGIKRGTFGPPCEVPPYSYVQLQALIGDAQTSLTNISPAEVNSFEARDVVFETRKTRMLFTVSGFLLSFSLPNFYFHATTAYDILRFKGVPLGKRDFVGQPRAKNPYKYAP